MICKTRAPARGRSARTSFDDPEVDDEQRKDAAWALAERRFDRDPEGWEPPERLAPGRVDRSAALITTAALSVLVVIGGIFALNRAWDARDNNPGIVRMVGPRGTTRATRRSRIPTRPVSTRPRKSSSGS